MAKTKDEKKQSVAEYRDRLRLSKAVYLIEPKGITPNEATELKKALFNLNSQFNVVKNSLFKLALKDEGMDLDEDLLDGPNAAVFTSEQSLSEAAKIISKFIKDSEKGEIKGGILDGKFVSKDQVEALANLPSREQLLAQVVGTMYAPVSGFVNVLAGNIRSILYVLNAVKEQKA
ncbi:50S ribosomal protein L10 [Candidatus Dojkabacteria bacterium]|nr:50S ribosomal protein L10 [Candidatus Dojkabacteria bacterium]